jgi:hypothetical protein
VKGGRREMGAGNESVHELGVVLRRTSEESDVTDVFAQEVAEDEEPEP